MAELDARTLLYVTGGISILQAVVLLAFQQLVGIRYPGVGILVGASFVNMSGYLLLILRGDIPNFWSIVVANGCLAAAVALTFAGINRFTEQSRPREERWAYGLVGLLVISYWLLLDTTATIALRVTIASLILSLLNMLVAWSLWRVRSLALRGAARFTAVVFTANGLMLLLRAIGAQFTPPGESLFAANPLQIATFSTAIISLLLWLFGMILLIIQRLQNEVALARASERATLEQAAREANQRAEETSAREQLFRITFEYSPLGAALIAAGGHVVRVNQTLCTMTELTAADLQGQAILPFLNSEQQHEIRQAIGELRAGSERAQFRLYRRRNGTEKQWFQITIGPVRNEAGAPTQYLALVEDITRSKQAEARQEMILRTMPDPFWFKDRHGRYIMWSDAFLTFHGLSAEQLANHTAVEVFGDHGGLVIEASDNPLFASGQSIRSELEVSLHSTNELRWIDSSKTIVYDDEGEAIGLIGLLRDITERKRTEEALRDRETLLRTLSDTMPDGLIYQIERAPNAPPRFTYISAGVSSLWGVSPEEVYADPEAIWGKIHPEDRPQFERNSAIARQTMAISEAEMRVILPNGKMRWSYSRSTPRRLADGTIISSGIELDISARRQIEAALQQRVEEQLALNRIAQSLTTMIDFEHGLTEIVPMVQSLFAAERMAIWQFATTRFELLFAADQGGRLSPAWPLPREQSADLSTLLDQSEPIITCLEQWMPLLYPPYVSQPSSAGHEVILIVLRARNEPIGVFCLQSARRNEHYRPNDRALAQTLGNMLAGVLQNTRLFAQAQIAAAEQERRRLARELHDSVSQALLAANRTAETLPYLWELDPDEGRDALATLHRFTNSALAEVRAMLVELHPQAITATPLNETLLHLTPIIAAKHAIELTTELAAVPRFVPEVQIALYRIAQEALNNIGKHAQAACATITLQYEANLLTLEIRDNGRGFAPQASQFGRMGLISMRERANEIGAELSIESHLGSGTRVRVVWPLLKGE